MVKAVNVRIKVFIEQVVLTEKKLSISILGLLSCVVLSPELELELHELFQEHTFYLMGNNIVTFTSDILCITLKS